MKESYIRMIQYLLAVVIVIIIGFHLQLFSSLIGPGYIHALSWSAVAARMNNPFYDAIYVILLFAVLTHGFIGIRNVVYEFISSQTKRVIASWVIFIVYIILLAYGLAPIIASAP